MGIRRSESCKVARYLVLTVVLVVMVETACYADAQTAIEALAATYKSGQVITAKEAEAAVASLEKVSGGCGDEYLAYRLRYRIAVLYFKAGMMEESGAGFLRIANEAQCPDLLRVCSFNMAGQIARLRGRSKDALAAFEQVASLLEQRLAAGGDNDGSLASAKLLLSALVSKAEIYELQGDFNAGIAEYNRLRQIPAHNKKEEMAYYKALANDRLSQLYLRQGDVEDYKKTARGLIEEYPQYYRTAIMKLEVECVEFLKSVSADLEFGCGSFEAPAKAIAYVRNSKYRTSAMQLVNRLDAPCRQYANSYGGTLLRYHYAWLLDALGDKDKAIEMLARTSCVDAENIGGKSRRKVILETIVRYAKIQQAIMLAERADYAEALRALGGLRAEADKSHISELAESVGKSIEILKREHVKDENE